MNKSQLRNIVKRLPAEWESQRGILIAWPHEASDWCEYLDDARRQFARIISEMARHGENVFVVACDADDARGYIESWFHEEIGDSRGLDRVNVVAVEINDTWTRDYGPITVYDEDSGQYRCLDFGFNAWGLKFAADRDNQVNSALKSAGVIDGESYVDCRDFILEGGSIESDGRGTLLTTEQCLLSANRNPTYTKEEIEELLRQRLGINHFLWLTHGHITGDDTDSHIDTLCRLAPGDVIFYISSGETDDPDHDELERMLRELTEFRTPDDRPYNLMELPLPDPIYNDEGDRLAATYANFLVTPANVYIPSYGQPAKDRLAAMTIQAVYHDRQVVPVDCRVLIRQGGSLHCSTMQLL